MKRQHKFYADCQLYSPKKSCRKKQVKQARSTGESHPSRGWNVGNPRLLFRAMTTLFRMLFRAVFMLLFNNSMKGHQAIERQAEIWAKFPT
ncbi:MAG: hypothetical protein V4564_14485 [Pseudomonadota bacterium]